MATARNASDTRQANFVCGVGGHFFNSMRDMGSWRIFYFVEACLTSLELARRPAIILRLTISATYYQCEIWDRAEFMAWNSLWFKRFGELYMCVRARVYICVYACGSMYPICYHRGGDTCIKISREDDGV